MHTNKHLAVFEPLSNEACVVAMPFMAWLHAQHQLLLLLPNTSQIKPKTTPIALQTLQLIPSNPPQGPAILPSQCQKQRRAWRTLQRKRIPGFVFPWLSPLGQSARYVDVAYKKMNLKYWHSNWMLNSYSFDSSKNIWNVAVYWKLVELHLQMLMSNC